MSTITRDVTDSQGRMVAVAYDDRIQYLSFHLPDGSWGAYKAIGDPLRGRVSQSADELVDLICWTIQHADLITDEVPDHDGAYPAAIIATVNAALEYGYGPEAEDNAKEMATAFFDLHREFVTAATDNVPAWLAGWATAVMIHRARRNINAECVWNERARAGAWRNVLGPVRKAILKAYGEKVERAALDAEDAARDTTYV